MDTGLIEYWVYVCSVAHLFAIVSLLCSATVHICSVINLEAGAKNMPEEVFHFHKRALWVSAIVLVISLSIVIFVPKAAVLTKMLGG